MTATRILLLFLTGYVQHSLACVSVVVICTAGGFPGEIQWNITQSGALVTSGIGGENKTACLTAGVLVNVSGSDSYGDSWNGATLRVIDVFDGTEVFLPSWTGPSRIEIQNHVTMNSLTSYQQRHHGVAEVPG